MRRAIALMKAASRAENRKPARATATVSFAMAWSGMRSKKNFEMRTSAKARGPPPRVLRSAASGRPRTDNRAASGGAASEYQGRHQPGVAFVQVQGANLFVERVVGIAVRIALDLDQSAHRGSARIMCHPGVRCHMLEYRTSCPSPCSFCHCYWLSTEARIFF